MAQCRFCERTFKNKQSVRSHLKACEKYLAVKDKPKGERLIPTPTMPMRTCADCSKTYTNTTGRCPSCGSMSWR